MYIHRELKKMKKSKEQRREYCKKWKKAIITELMHTGILNVAVLLKLAQANVVVLPKTITLQ